MGTRADYYIGRGENAEWLGSTAWDGGPGWGKTDDVLAAKTEQEFRQAVSDLAKTEGDFTSPEDGWPWPWEDSRTTDYAYAWDSEVFYSYFGYGWHAHKDGPEPEWPNDKTAVFPNMKSQQNVAKGSRSGMMMITFKPSGEVEIE